MNISKIINAILSIRPNAEFTQKGNTYEDLEWLDVEQVKPSKTEWEYAIAKIEEVEQQKKATAEAKLAALGLEPDDLKALGL